MPGLLSQQPGAAAAPGSSVAPAGAAGNVTGEEQPNVSPEEQQAYDQFVDTAFSAIYDDKSLPQIIKSLQGDGNPVDGLANTAVAIVTRVEDSAKNAGQTVSPDVVFHAGTEILEDLADLAAKAGVHDFTPEELEGAAFQAMDLYREMNGRDGGEGRPQIVEDFNQIVALDQQGRLDEMAPGLSQKFGAGQAGAGRVG